MTFPMSRPRVRTLLAYFVMTALTLLPETAAHSTARATVFDDPPASAFEPTGLQSGKGYFAQLPFERVDMINGGVILSFTDLALPGDAGMDLRLVRSYNSQVNGKRWEFGIDGVPIRIGLPDGNGSSCCEYPTLFMADGTQHRTRPRDTVYNDTVFLTQQFWRYTTTTHTLEMPNGWVATYESGSPSGGVMLLEVHDQFGNAITPEWTGISGSGTRPLRMASVTQTVSGDTRTVTFDYDPVNCPYSVPETMTYDGREWTYGCTATSSGYSGPLLASVTPPDGPGWSFSHVEGNGLDGSFTVTTPMGGTVMYDYADVELPSTDETHRSVLATRVTGGRGIPAGTWTFTFEQSSSVPARGTVVGPGDRSVEFNHAWAPALGNWALAEKILREDTTVHGTWSRAYVDLPYSDAFPSATYPLPAEDTLVQEGATYTTTYTYGTTNLGNYHQPSTIVEAGQLTRTTTRTFRTGFTPYLTNRVASESVTVSGGGTFGKSWTYDDDTGFVESETVYGVTTTFEPDARGNRASATDAESQTTEFTYEYGTVKNTITPEYTITRSINADGSVASETRGGATTSFDYDDIGRLTLVTPPVGDAIEHGYEGNGASQWVERVPTWSTTFLDGFGRPVGTENAEGIKTTITYDADGRKTFESYPFTGSGPSGGESFTYDALNRVKEIERPGSVDVVYTYTATAVAIEDENGHTTTQTWAAFGSPGDRRLVSVTDAASKTWSYSYTTLGGLTGVDQPDGPDRTWTYNSHHWVTSESHPESGTTNYTHDNVGNVLSKEIVGRSITIEYQYDNNHRLTDILAPGSLHDVDLAYDARDNRTGLSNGTVATTILYDDGNRPYHRTDVIDGESFVTQYGYDTRDNLTSVTYPSGRVVTYAYDYADRITGVTGPSATWASSFSYHASGAVAGYTSGNGQTTSISYDARQRPDVLASGPLSLNYDYDDVGNVTAIDDARPGFDQGFGYDVIDRLTSVTGYGAETYGYDARGNRTTKGSATYTYHGSSDHLTSDGVQSYTYDGAGNASTIGSQAFTYTPFALVETATVGSAVTTYRYDGDNQRRLRVRADGTKEYFVPGPGLVPLAEYRKAPSGSRVLVREYIYAGDRLIASVGLEPTTLPGVTWTDDPIVAGVTDVKAVHLSELRDAVNAARTAHGLSPATWTDATVTPSVTVIQAVHITELRTAINAVYTAAGVTPPTYTDATLTVGATAVKAVHLTELRAARASAPGGEATAPRFYHHDALGSVRAVTDASGGTVRRHDYTAFGEAPTPAVGADARRFTGKERDAETGLDYFSARYYGSTSGRFTTVDPIVETERSLPDPQRWNRYAYALNGPMRYGDPDGRSATLLGAIIGAAVGATRAAVQGASIRDIGAAAAGGAVSGAVVGSVIDTGGATLPVLIGTGAIASTAGLGVENALAGRQTTIGDAAMAAAAGASGVALGQGLGRAAVSQSRDLGLSIRSDISLAGGRSGELVKDLVGPPNSVVRGASGRVFITNNKGQVILDVTRQRVKPVSPGQGFGQKRMPTKEELDLLTRTWSGGG